LVVTHDVSEAESFDRVLVLSHGRVVEQGTPSELRERSDSVYSQLLTEAAGAPAALWGGTDWTRWRMERGQLTCE
jgi:ABC-type multidrug transport system ATPase subunit